MTDQKRQRKRKSSEDSHYEQKKSKIDRDHPSEIRRCASRKKDDNGYCSTEVSRWRSRSRRRQNGDKRYDRDSGINSRSHDRSRARVRNDRDGHLVFEEGDFLHKRYKLGKVLGKGTFGKVVLAEDYENGRREVAVKIVRNNKDDFKDAMMEVDIVHDLQRASSEADKLICCIRDSFNHHGHACIVFDRLGLSLYEFMKRNRYQSFFSGEIRKVAYKLCKALHFCHSNGLAHTDVKPENILFVDSDYELLHASHYSKGTYRWVINSDVRVVDFGSAVYKHQHKGVVQTRQYRAPEVILGLRWSFPCDMWSVGCILFEMYHGEMLFQTHGSLEHLAIMDRVLGPMPSHMVDEATSGGKGGGYFKGHRLRWDKDSREGVDVRKRSQALELYMREDRHEGFFDLLRQLLQFDPHKRCTAKEALDHPFFHEINSG